MTSLRPGDAWMDHGQGTSVRIVIEYPHRADANRHQEERELEVARSAEHQSEEAERHDALHDQRLADVVHAVTLLVAGMKHVDHQPRELEDRVQKDGEQRVGATGQRGIAHRENDCGAPRQRPEAQVLAHAVLAMNVGDLVGVGSVLRDLGEHAIDRHGKRIDACRVIPRREPHDENCYQPLADHVEERTHGVPQHVALDG